MKPERIMPIATIRSALLFSIVTTSESSPLVFYRVESLNLQFVAYLVALEDTWCGFGLRNLVIRKTCDGEVAGYLSYGFRVTCRLWSPVSVKMALKVLVPCSSGRCA